MTTAADTFVKSPVTRSGGTNAAEPPSGAPLMKYLNERLSTCHFVNLEAPLAATVSAIAEPLTVRQTDILDQIAQGRSNKEIARILSITPETVKTHVKHIFIKLKVGKRVEAVSRAYNLRLVEAEDGGALRGQRGGAVDAGRCHVCLVRKACAASGVLPRSMISSWPRYSRAS